jgi:hypothetical protein
MKQRGLRRLRDSRIGVIKTTRKKWSKGSRLRRRFEITRVKRRPRRRRLRFDHLLIVETI